MIHISLTPPPPRAEALVHSSLDREEEHASQPLRRTSKAPSRLTRTSPTLPARACRRRRGESGRVPGVSAGAAPGPCRRGRRRRLLQLDPDRLLLVHQVGDEAQGVLPRQLVYVAHLLRETAAASGGGGGRGAQIRPRKAKQLSHAGCPGVSGASGAPYLHPHPGRRWQVGSFREDKGAPVERAPRMHDAWFHGAREAGG